jgi:hypothetical protein
VRERGRNKDDCHVDRERDGESRPLRRPACPVAACGEDGSGYLRDHSRTKHASQRIDTHRLAQLIPQDQADDAVAGRREPDSDAHQQNAAGGSASRTSEIASGTTPPPIPWSHARPG